MTENTVSNTDSIRLSVIEEAYSRGMRYENITPDMQIAPWLAIGLKRMAENQKVTLETIAKIDKMGGTDHPDPWFH